MMRDKIWIIEWSILAKSFRIMRFQDMSKVVGHDFYIQDAIRNINANYPEWEVILIRDQAGCVSYKLNDENPEILTFVENLRRLM